MSDDTSARLADALDALAKAIDDHPGAVIGQQITVTAGPDTRGTVIGEEIRVTAGPGARGNIIGKRIVVEASGRNEGEVKAAEELRKVAAAVRQGQVPKSWVDRALERAGGLANAAMTAGARGMTAAMLEHYAPK